MKRFHVTLLPFHIGTPIVVRHNSLVVYASILAAPPTEDSSSESGCADRTYEVSPLMGTPWCCIDSLCCNNPWPSGAHVAIGTPCVSSIPCVRTLGGCPFIDGVGDVLLGATACTTLASAFGVGWSVLIAWMICLCDASCCFMCASHASSRVCNAFVCACCCSNIPRACCRAFLDSSDKTSIWMVVLSHDLHVGCGARINARI